MSTKVICTIGPASNTEEMFGKLIDSGMSIARFNMSHAWTPELIEVTKKQMETVQKVRAQKGADVEIALDTKGPDVRIGTFKDNKAIVVEAGQTFKFYVDKKYSAHVGDINGVYVDYEKLLRIVKPGAELCLNDGHVIMQVAEIADGVVTTTVKAGGKLSNRKSLAAPGHDLELPFISPEDERDFLMGIAVGVEWVMASAVMRPKDIEELRKFWRDNGGKEIKIMSKIEDRTGLGNLDALIEASDAIMVARGGLGTDIGLAKLPAAQKLIIEKTRKAGKLVVCATEMLESMAEKPNATRAEASDVANAVWDGANYVMLSCETAAGKYPCESVEFMLRVAREAESHKEYFRI